MLWISKDCRWEIAIDPHQWMIGCNWCDVNANIFFLCFRLGRNSDKFLKPWLNHGIADYRK